MTVEEIVRYFSTHFDSVRRSASETMKNTHSTKEDVIEAKKIFLSNGKPKHPNFPKILIFDIETAPIKAYVWKTWKENVSLDQIINDWFVICWSAKWLYADEMMGECLTPKEIKRENDRRIVRKLWELFDEADIVIAHNAIKFDVPKMNTRFVKYGLNPPSCYQIIDTLQVAKREFKFTSNKLDALAMHFGFDKKLETDFSLWVKCLEGDQKALDYMFKYNKYDVELLEAVYLKLRPWIHNHPNIGNYFNDGNPVCSCCGSHELKTLYDHCYKTQISTYRLYRCEKCGAISRGRISLSKGTKMISPAR